MNYHHAQVTWHVLLNSGNQDAVKHVKRNFRFWTLSIQIYSSRQRVSTLRLALGLRVKDKNDHFGAIFRSLPKLVELTSHGSF